MPRSVWYRSPRWMPSVSAATAEGWSPAGAKSDTIRKGGTRSMLPTTSDNYRGPVTSGDRRWTLYPAAIIIAVLLAVVIASATAQGADSVRGRLGGDFIEFYGAGRIVVDGDADELYSPTRQARAQADLVAEDETGQGVLFAYPAVVAGPYAALARLDYRVAYLVNTAAMLVAFAIAILLLRPRLSGLRDRRHHLAAAALGLTFLPMFVGLTVGQNTGFTLLALVAVWWGLDTGRHGWAGLAAGLLLVKPQLALPVIGLLLLARWWRAVGGAVVGAALVWLGSAAVAGPGWMSPWFDLATSIGTVDRGTNLPNEVSSLGVAQALLGRDSSVAAVLGVTGAALVALVLIHTLRRHRRVDELTAALVLPSLLLIAPHALYYDAGLLLVSVGALVPRLPAERRLAVLTVWWLAGFGHLAAEPLGVEPVAALVIATWLWAVRETRRAASTSDGRHPDHSVRLAGR